jgi:5-methylcytosine-specific restriction endonuclease McrA
MFKCKFCNKETSSKNGNTFHQDRCKLNVNRIKFNWEGRKHSEQSKRNIGKKNREGLKKPKTILDMSSRTKMKVVKRMNICCATCGWKEASCDIHHIIPKSKGGTDEHNNLTHICPNCHRLAHEGKLTKFVSLQEQIGDSWINNYYASE